jgi:hypothetical protein
MRLCVPVRAMAAFALVCAGAGLSFPRVAHAAKHDLNLLNLCTQAPPAVGRLNAQVPECTWVQRAPGGLVTQVAIPTSAEDQFRSLMSELGVVLAPRLMTPAATLGFAGFEFAGELGLTQISNNQPYWNGVEGLSAQNTAVGRPDAWLTTVGAFVRKGVWIGLPAFELGAGFVNVLNSRLMSWQAYAKLALHEGYTRMPLPSVAVRAGISYLTGTDQVRMTVTSFDVIASKGFGVGGTFRLEPFVAFSLMRITADSGVIDATPSCDAYQVQTAKPGDKLGEYCANNQAGTSNDRLAYFAFSDQEPIRRQRFSGGAKIKFASVFITGQYDIFPAGDSRDGRKANGARDTSAQQTAFSLSGGFDF